MRIPSGQGRFGNVFDVFNKAYEIAGNTMHDAFGTPILITDGAGYIESHACNLLRQAGYRPIVYDNLAHGHRWAVRWGPLEVGDIRGRARLDAYSRAIGPRR